MRTPRVPLGVLCIDWPLPNPTMALLTVDVEVVDTEGLADTEGDALGELPIDNVADGDPVGDCAPTSTRNATPKTRAMTRERRAM